MGGHYVDAGTQTAAPWAGLMQKETVRPETLFTPPRDTNTPPDDMLTPKSQFIYGGVVPSIASPPSHSDLDKRDVSPTSTLLERRQNHPGLVARLSMPSSDILNDEVPLSPPTTHALLSPLPEANRRHAGHTPLIPRALSPEPEKAGPHPADDGNATLDADKGLTGALTLPTNPVDGAEDYIGLDVLDHRLGKIAKQQAILRGEFDDDDAPNLQPKPQPKADSTEATEDGQPLSRKGSADSRKSGMSEDVDGVLLKTPPSNFGAPLGSL